MGHFCYAINFKPNPISMKSLLAMILVCMVVVANGQDKKPQSPAAKAEGKIGAANITINYSAPSVRGRKIFGELEPFGKVWRTGANASTSIEFSAPVKIEGKDLAAGKYALFTIPGENEWTIIFNKTIKWGALAAKYNKLELQRYQEEIDQMNGLYGGIKNMDGKPGAIFIVDVVNEMNAVREALKLGIKTVAIVDTNADPTDIDYPIPANDDAIKTIQLIVDYMKQAVEAGKAKHQKKADKTEKVADKEEK
jgi:hypothetical protein